MHVDAFRFVQLHCEKKYEFLMVQSWSLISIGKGFPGANAFVGQSDITNRCTGLVR